MASRELRFVLALAVATTGCANENAAARPPVVEVVETPDAGRLEVTASTSGLDTPPCNSAAKVATRERLETDLARVREQAAVAQRVMARAAAGEMREDAARDLQSLRASERLLEAQIKALRRGCEELSPSAPIPPACMCDPGDPLCGCY